MSSKKTTNYKLHQWEATDDFLRTEFNENFGTLDTAVRNLLIAGSYTGSGTDTRTINLGFTPRLVFVISEQADIREGAYTYGGIALKGQQCRAVAVVEGVQTATYAAGRYTTGKVYSLLLKENALMEKGGRVKVSAALAKSLQQGDAVRLLLHPGALGVPWLECVPLTEKKGERQ